jgi:hypothetical protein
VLLRLAYLTVTNTFAVLRLFPMSDRGKVSMKRPAPVLSEPLA